MDVLARSTSPNAGNMEKRENSSAHVLLFQTRLSEPPAWRALQDPEAYLPERFLRGTPEAAARPENGWIPFGGGARGCPGGKFSLEEATIAIIRMYQRFRFALEPGQVRTPPEMVEQKHAQLHGVHARHPLTGASGAARDHHAVASTWRAHAGLPLALGRVMPQVGCTTVDVLAAGLSGWGGTA